MSQMDRLNKTEQVWLNAWLSVATAENCLSSERAARWADDCLKGFQERFQDNGGDSPEIDRLRAIEAAARRFDASGSTVHQMSPAQWEAYTELKALFHGGIAFRT